MLDVVQLRQRALQVLNVLEGVVVLLTDLGLVVRGREGNLSALELAEDGQELSMSIQFFEVGEHGIIVVLILLVLFLEFHQSVCLVALDALHVLRHLVVVKESGLVLRGVLLGGVHVGELAMGKAHHDVWRLAHARDS